MSTLKTCTSTTRPSPTDPALGNRPTAGDMLFETDTKRIIMFDGTEWYVYDYNITTAPIYTVTIEDSVGGNETMTNQGPFTGGTVITLTHAEDTGYDFESWSATNERTGEIIEVVGNTFVMPYANVTVVANYVPVPTYAVAVNGGDNGTTLTTVTTAEAGDTITVSANPNPDFALSTISVTDANLNSVDIVDHGNNTFTFAMPAANATVATFYVPTYAITVNGGVAGTTTVDVDKAVQGASIVVTTTPNDQFELASITVTDGNSANVPTIDNRNGTHTFVMPGSAATITTEYVVKTYAVNIESPENGTTTSNLAEASLNNGVIITTAADQDYLLSSIVIVDENSNIIPTTDNGDGTHSLTMPGAAITVTTVYSLITFDVVVNGGENGTTLANVQEASRTETVTVTAVANDNYSLEYVKVIDLSIEAAASTFEGSFPAVAYGTSANTTITANTGGDSGNKTIVGDGSSTIAVLASLQDATVDVSGDASLGEAILKSGSEVVLSGGADATASTFTGTFNLAGENGTSSEVTITADTLGDETITLTGDETTSVSALATAAGATATGDGALQVLAQGETITITGGTNTVTAGFTGTFDTHVESDSQNVSITSNELGLGNIELTGDGVKTIAALAIEANAAASGSGAIEILRLGEVVTLVGTANTIATTVNEDGGYEFVMPESAVNVTSSFSINQYNIVVSGGENGSTEANVILSPKDENITVTATPNEGFVFNSISVVDSSDAAVATIDNENGTYNFVMPESDVTVTTAFDQLYAINVSETTNGTTAASETTAISGTSITVATTPATGYDLDSLTVTDAADQPVNSVDNGNGTHTFLMPASDVTISSVYVATFNITVNGGENGTTTADATEAEPLDTVVVTATADEGFSLDTIVVVNNSITELGSSFDGTFTAVSFGTSESTTITADSAGAGDIVLTGDGTSTIGALATAASATVDISADETLDDAILKSGSTVTLTGGSDATANSFTGTFVLPDDNNSTEVTLTSNTTGAADDIVLTGDGTSISTLASAAGVTVTGDGDQILKSGETVTLSGGQDATASSFTGTFDTRVEATSANVSIVADEVAGPDIVLTGNDTDTVATLAIASGATATGDGSTEILKSGETITLTGSVSADVETTDNGDGTFTFTMPSGDVTVTTTYA